MKRRTLVASLAILAIAAWTLHKSARMLLHSLEPCDKPCRWAKGKGYADCSPIAVGLQMMTTTRPMGNGEEVWYRAAITNNSCEILSLGDKFLESNDDYAPSIRLKTGTYLVVYDSEGRALPVYTEPSGIQMGDAERTIHPYNYDSSAHKPFITRLYDEDYLTLLPGQSIATSPSILAPYHDKYITVRMPGMIGTALAPEPINMPDAAKRYAVPPKGFRRTVEYNIAHRGVYTAEILVNEQVWAHLRYRHESYPKWLREVLWFFAIGEPYDGFFKPELSIMKTASNRVRFEVK